MEETLDPKDWNELRKLGHQMVDDMMEYLETIRKRPLWQPIPLNVKSQFQLPVPHDGVGQDEVYDEFKKFVLPYPLGNIHPGFWGWVIGTGSPMGMFAEMLASGMNPNQGGGEHIANYVEMQILDWFKEIFGLPKNSSGLLVSGGSMANLVGITVGRNSKAPNKIREQGVHNQPKILTCYSSVETHSSNIKVVELLGLGRDNLRLIPVNENFQIDILKLEKAIKQDKSNNFQPFCVIGNVGTINTGSIDDINILADICEREGMWFHIDGAFGALAILSKKFHNLVAGLNRADSLAFDLHKWMYIPIEIGCVLVRHSKDHYNAFSLIPDYLEHGTRGIAGASHWFSDYGILLSRGFKGLKAWMEIKLQGIDKFGRLIEQNIEQAHYFTSLVESSDKLELLAPTVINVVCFRYSQPELDANTLDSLNKELLILLQEGGKVAPSNTLINGNYALRIAITNHRSRKQDFDLLFNETIRIGLQLAIKLH